MPTYSKSDSERPLYFSADRKAFSEDRSFPSLVIFTILRLWVSRAFENLSMSATSTWLSPLLDQLRSKKNWELQRREFSLSFT